MRLILILARTARGLNQTAIGKRVNKSTAWVSRVEAGRTQLSLEQAQRLEPLLKTPAELILLDVEHRPQRRGS
jgi:transcriptional regulator with XRE-family HTH domain